MTLGVENLPPAAAFARRSGMMAPKRSLLVGGGEALGLPAEPGAAAGEACQPGLTGHPVKSGPVHALHSGPDGRPVRLPVILKVYVSNFGRYAVVAQDKLLCRECGFINLKQCTVRRVDNHKAASSTATTTTSSSAVIRSSKNNKDSHVFQITPRNAEGQSLTFSVSSVAEVEDWMNALLREGEEGGCGQTTEGGALSPRRQPPTGLHPKTGLVASPCRRPRSPLGQLSPMRVASPQVKRKSLLPALEEE